MKIAVIGSGISGLIATEDLRSGHDVTLFEASPRLGGHTNTVEVDLDGERLCVDTGFIVFNDRTYPNFCARLDAWGVAWQPTEMSFSVRCDAANLEYNGASLNKLFIQRWNLLRPGFHRMIRDILRFNREATAMARSRSDGESEPTVAAFLAAGRYSTEFAEHYLLPMGAAIWSCPMGVFSQFPIRFIAEFYHHHGLLSLRGRPHWRTVKGGSRRYIEALIERWGSHVEIRLSTPVASVRRLPHSVRIGLAGRSEEAFDHVVFACHSDQALRLLSDPTPTEREVLSSIPYGRNVAVLHTDTRLLPRRRGAWASWNYLLPDADRRHSAPATLTYCMNILQGLRSAHTVCVTLNAEDQVDPKRVLGRFQYEHPIFTTDRAKVLARHRELLNANRTSFCGAYWGNGFHEDGVVSAMAVARAIGSGRRDAAVRRSAHSPLEVAT